MRRNVEKCVLRALIRDRRRGASLLAVAVVMVVGASLAVILSSTNGGGSSPAVAAASGSPPAVAPKVAPAVVTVARRRTGRTVRVSIRRFLFHARTVRIERGSRVRWTNRDRSEHTATEEGKFDTGVLGRGAGKTVTFEEAGTYRYICGLHPFMRGRVIVR
jgi:plastocyanin